MSKQRIGILFGIPDPPLSPYLSFARTVLKDKNLDRVLLIPSVSHTDPEDCWKMLTAACCGDPSLEPFRPESYPDPSAGPEKLASFFSGIIPDAKVVCVREYPRNSSLNGSPDGTLRFQGQSERDIPVLEYIGAKGLYGCPVRIPESASWLDKLFSTLKPRRFAHSLAVADTARLMARRFGENPLKAEKAGLLHDCAKNLPLPEMQQIARRYHLPVDQAFMESNALLHSVVGACVAQQEYGMDDPEILDAIRYHNTGFPGMSRLAMCVCLSDSIEPTRRSYPLLDQVRKLADHSLEKALLLSLEGTAGFVRSKGDFLHPRTRETIAWLKTLPSVQK